MRTSSVTPTVMLWTSAYLGCAIFLLVSLLPPDSVSLALLGQLSWLALIGSIPTALVLGAAARAANASRSLVVASSVAVSILVAPIGWEHADFLLSGPQWLFHPQRLAIRIGMTSAISLLGAGGWRWLILGARDGGGRWLAGWIALTAIAVALLTAAIVRYRAYDYSTAQLVFPAGVLLGAVLQQVDRAPSVRPLTLGVAGAFMLFGVGSRLSPEMVATGQRELIAHSRAGALATLYVLPHLDPEGTWSTSGIVCPEPKPIVEQSPIGIEPHARRNVIIVTVDALRNDVVGIEVDGHQVTPNLSRLAKAGVSFTKATSPYPATLFAMGSAFTGLSPAELYLAPALPDTIFTRARAHVDRQFAVLPGVSWFRLPIIEQFLTPGVKTAFAPNDAAATDAFIARLRASRDGDSSVMAWIHYYSPHDPYQSHPEFPFGNGKRNAYLSEVAYFDHELGRLMQYLTEEGWLENTLVVFFSDHGEALGERSYWGHHVYLDSWMVDVPLVLWHAALMPAERRVGVSLADVAPTVLHFLGLPIPSDIPAQSLFTLDPDLVNRPSFSEAFPVRGRELFDSFLLPALDDASIVARLRSIRVASKGYEPKGAIRRDGERLIHHRGADTTLFYRDEAPVDGRLNLESSDPEASKLLRSELEHWELRQVQRIQCRLQLSGVRDATPRPE
ncbi:MAG: sulfatase [Polyangiales bacterium]